jgi:hypothetical protein
MKKVKGLRILVDRLATAMRLFQVLLPRNTILVLGGEVHGPEDDQPFERPHAVLRTTCGTRLEGAFRPSNK